MSYRWLVECLSEELPVALDEAPDGGYERLFHIGIRVASVPSLFAHSRLTEGTTIAGAIDPIDRIRFTGYFREYVVARFTPFLMIFLPSSATARGRVSSFLEIPSAS